MDEFGSSKPYSYGGGGISNGGGGAGGGMQLDLYGAPHVNDDQFGKSYGCGQPQTQQLPYYEFDYKPKKNKSSSSSSKVWCFSDPEYQRKRRVASYRAYSVEGKVKGSFKKGFRWIKRKYCRIINGWW